MPRKKRDEFVAGIFVILALAMTFGVVVWLGASEWFHKPKAQAVFYVENTAGASGLAVGNPIQIADLAIGTIAQIRPDPAHDRTLYVVDLNTDAPIYADAKTHVAIALIGTPGLIITSRGTTTQPRADDEHPAAINGGMDLTMNSLASAADNLNEVSKTLRAETDPAKAGAMLAKVHMIMDDIKLASADFARLAANVTGETDPAKSGSIIQKAKSSITGVDAIIADMQPKIQRLMIAAADTAERIDGYTKKDIGDMLTSLREANTQILKITKDFAAVSQDAREVVAMNRDNLDTMIDNMTQVSENLKSTAKEVRRNPWRLLYKPTEKETHSQDIYDAARSFSNGAEQLDQAIGKLQGLAKANPDGMPANDPELQKVRKQILETFGKFSKVEKALWDELQK